MDIVQDIPDPQPTAGNHSKPISRGNPISRGCSALLGAVVLLVSPPQPHPPAALKVWGFPRDYSIHIQRLMPQEGFFFPGFSYSQSANSTKSRMQAQSSASAMLWLHTAYTGATPGILTTLPKPAKGMREKLVAWKKRSNIWNYYQEQQKLLLYAAGHMKHFPSN